MAAGRLLGTRKLFRMSMNLVCIDAVECHAGILEGIVNLEKTLPAYFSCIMLFEGICVIERQEKAFEKTQ